MRKCLVLLLTMMIGDDYKLSQAWRPSVIRTIKKDSRNIPSSVDPCAHAVIETVEGRVSATAI
jgi:hypothetical protein